MKAKFGVIVGFFYFFWFAGMANAYFSESFTYDTNTGSAALPWTENFQLQTFNTNLGTLTGITLTTTAQFTTEVDVYNALSSPHSFTNAFSAEPVTVTLPSSSGTVTLAPSGTTIVSGLSGTAAPGFNAFQGVQETFTQQTAISNFSLLQGSGTGYAAFTVFAADGPTGVYGGSGISGLYFGGQLANSVDAAVTVTYDFSSTPLPASRWLFGSGLAGLIGIRRKYLG